MSESNVNDCRELIRQVFVGYPADDKGRKVQSLMYYIYDVCRLGFELQSTGDDKNVVKCFKNEISHLMKSVMTKHLPKEVKTKDDAAKVFIKMTEVLTKELSSLLTYMFGEMYNKKHYALGRIRDVSDSLSLQIRQDSLHVI